MAERLRAAVVALLFSCAAGAFASSTAHGAAPAESASDARDAVFARSQLWQATDIARMNLLVGPHGPGAFRFRETVVCKYLDKKLDGRSPKFACRIGKNDEVKVKYGGANGEVYGEVLATRLLWALGFGADRMYPVNVICQGCPMDLNGIERPHHEMRFDPAVIERKMDGLEWPSADESGWSWTELDRRVFAPTGAPVAQRDALKLLAVFLQHTDSKPEQQRVLCLDAKPVANRTTCRRPFLMISDLGLTFGKANMTNANHTGGVNLVEWRRTPVWKDGGGCTGNLPKSFSGTLDNPVIGEAGRRFLAGLLVQLSDRQLFDLFESARVRLRLRDPGDVSSGFPTTAEWVDAFKQKRAQIIDRRCA
jgi:hypothetical protein